MTDPFDPHRIACFGDSMVTVWDARKLSLPLLSFTERDAGADGARARTVQSGGYVGIEFSGTRRGMLASLEKDAPYVRFWDMMGAQPHSYTFDDAVLDESKVGKAGRRSWANLPWPAGQHQTPPSPKDTSGATSGTLVLHDTRRSTSTQSPSPSVLKFSSCLAKTFNRALASFTLVPNTSVHPYPLNSNVMVVNKEGDLELYAVHDAPKQATWSARGDLAISAGQTCRILEGFPESSLIQHINPRRTNSQSHSRSREAESVLRGRGQASSTHAASKSRQKTMTDPVIPPVPPPLFGRGDEEGFPALGSAAVSGSGSGAPTRGADWREKKGSASGITLDRPKRDSVASTVGGESINTTTTTGSTLAVGAGIMTTGRGSILGARHRRDGDGLEAGMGSRNPSMSHGRRIGRSANRVVEDDISMLMRRRALKGYGLSRVCSALCLFSSFKVQFNSISILATEQYFDCAG